MAATNDEPLDSARDWVAEHTRRYVESEGKDGYMWRGVPTLVLTTLGSKTKRLRRNALIFGRDGDAYVVVASYGGAPDHPSWYKNLRAEPKVSIQVGPDVIEAEARTATTEEKKRLWPAMVEIWPDYATYQTRTDRDIPVVLIERT
jgi:deazaflavin-dependent oxidoreductase (nitroreductase family)